MTNSNPVSFADLAVRSEADLRVRLILTRWQVLQVRSRKLAAELTMAKRRFGLQPEPESPETVGMNESPSDDYTPEELIALYTREPQVIDWDGDSCVPLADLAEAC